jgi:hypothetical protein
MALHIGRISVRGDCKCSVTAPAIECSISKMSTISSFGDFSELDERPRSSISNLVENWSEEGSLVAKSVTSGKWGPQLQEDAYEKSILIDCQLRSMLRG